MHYSELCHELNNFLQGGVPLSAIKDCFSLYWNEIQEKGDTDEHVAQVEILQIAVEAYENGHFSKEDLQTTFRHYSSGAKYQQHGVNEGDPAKDHEVEVGLYIDDFLGGNGMFNGPTENKSHDENSTLELLFFTSPSSIPCLKLETFLSETLTKQLPIKVTTIDVTKEPEVAEKYNIVICPTVIFRGVKMYGNDLDLEDLRKTILYYSSAGVNHYQHEVNEDRTKSHMDE
jgi:hypothetical protein